MNFLKGFKENKNKIFKKENFYYLTIIIIIFTLDRISKIQIINDFNDTPYYLNDFINLNLIWNIGIGFGFFSTDLSYLYNLITLVISVIIIILLHIFLNSNILDKLIYAIIIGGALGNLCDRLVYKAVPDFIDLHYNNFHWFTFNIADIFISMGIIIFIIRNFFLKN
ncbi:MAG: signal peptidase II [Candidatus Pelagibacter bacterium]|nr:signal peptidase II [Candidatus Pelagibacter bacterium]MBL6861137.1 signal peptidase II [Candidatus Pelagibacter bacterium]